MTFRKVDTIQKYKEFLKNLADDIRHTRSDMKENGKAGNIYKMACAMMKLQGLSWKYRHYHIAYCLLRGTEMEQIEKPAPDNQPNHERIEEIKNEFINNVHRREKRLEKNI